MASVFGSEFQKRWEMRRVLYTSVLLCLAEISIWGQAAGFGTISGTVRDASGSVVPGAKVVVSNAALGFNRELTTTDGGIFAAPALVPSGGRSEEHTSELQSRFGI